MKKRTILLCAFMLFSAFVVSACSNQSGNDEVKKTITSENQQPTDGKNEEDTTNVTDKLEYDSLLSCEAHDFVVKGNYIVMAEIPHFCAEDDRILLPQEHCHYPNTAICQARCNKHCSECTEDEKCRRHNRVHQSACHNDECLGCELLCTESDLEACPLGEGWHLFFKGTWCSVAFEDSKFDGVSSPVRIVIEPNESDKSREISIPYRTGSTARDNGYFIFRQQGRKQAVK